MESLLEIHNLSAGYGQNLVLQGVNLKIKPSDFIGVIGPNGGGKTTLLKAILGLITPISGTIHFSESMTSGGVHRIGYLPQINNIDRQFPITVFDVVRSGLMSRKRLMGRYSAEENESALHLIEEMGISDIRNNPITNITSAGRNLFLWLVISIRR